MLDIEIATLVSAVPERNDILISASIEKAVLSFVFLQNSHANFYIFCFILIVQSNCIAF